MPPKIDPETKAELLALGDRVRLAREKRGLSQADVASATGIERSNLIRIEKGRANVTIETLMRITRALDATLVVDVKIHRGGRSGAR